MFIMDNRNKRARLELCSPSSQTGVATGPTTFEIGGQSFILSNGIGAGSSLPANILLSICDDNSDESEEYIIDSSVLTQIKQENAVATQTTTNSNSQQQQPPATAQLLTTVPQYRIINQSGKTLLNHNNATTFSTTPSTALVTSQVSPKSTLIPTSMQLSSGCEIYVIKEIVEQQPPKQLLSETVTPVKTLGGSNNTTIKLEPLSPTPAPAAGALQILRTATANTSAATSSNQQQSIASNLCQNSIVVNNANISSSPHQQEDSTKRSLILEAYKKRDDKRRATHNEVERRRRDKINSWIFKLKEMLPSDVNNALSSAVVGSGGGGGGSTPTVKDVVNNNNTATSSSARLLIQQQGSTRTPPSDSKSQILIKACEYIKSMQEEIQSLRECLTENENLRLSNQRLQDELNNLRNKQEQQQRQHQTLNNNNNNHNSNNNTSNALLLSTHSDDECELTLNSLNTTYANVQLFSPNSTNLSSIIGPTTTTASVTSNSGIIYAKRELIIRDYVD